VAALSRVRSAALSRVRVESEKKTTGNADK
jgi:hypothetical protein